MKERKFKVGDKVTYKSINDCKGQFYIKGDHGKYYWGGVEQNGFVGTVKGCDSYIEDKDCYRLEVTCREGGSYSMLECEFVEYDKKPACTHDFTVGEKVIFDNKPVTILGFHYKESSCVIEGLVGSHSGDNKDYSHNQHGLYIYIPPAGKANRRYVEIKDLSKTLVKEKPKKEHKSLVGRWVRFNLHVSSSAKVGDTFIITEDDPDDLIFLNLKGYGAFDKIRFANGDCELLPEGWEQPKPIVNMLAIQEECKRLYPIGCTYISVKEKQVYELKEDYIVYTISGNNIYAHKLGGCLYMDGEYAQIILEMKPTMQDIQEECKRRFPIGCIYIRKGMGLEDKLELDSHTYRIVGDSIYAHCGGGYLYTNGQYSKLISVEAKLDRVMTTSDPKWAAALATSGHTVVSTTMDTSSIIQSFIKSPCAEIHIPNGITHQEAIITRKVKKSNKLIIK